MGDLEKGRGRRGFLRQLATLAGAGVAGLFAASPAAADAEGASAAGTAAACAIYCRPVVCDFTQECGNLTILFRCTSACGGSFLLCKPFSFPCTPFCYSRNVC